MRFNCLVSLLQVCVLCQHLSASSRFHSLYHPFNSQYAYHQTMKKYEGKFPNFLGYKMAWNRGFLYEVTGDEEQELLRVGEIPSRIDPNVHRVQLPTDHPIDTRRSIANYKKQRAAIEGLTEDHRFIFIGGLHHSGTSLLARYFTYVVGLPMFAAFQGTHKPENEGQFLQTVMKRAGKPAAPYGGHYYSLGRKEQDGMYLNELSKEVSDTSRASLFQSWAPHWNGIQQARFLVEKSPPNLIRTRFYPLSH